MLGLVCPRLSQDVTVDHYLYGNEGGRTLKWFDAKRDKDDGENWWMRWSRSKTRCTSALAGPLVESSEKSLATLTGPIARFPFMSAHFPRLTWTTRQPLLITRIRCGSEHRRPLRSTYS